MIPIFIGSLTDLKKPQKYFQLISEIVSPLGTQASPLKHPQQPRNHEIWDLGFFWC